MPELPEVETIRKQLAEALRGREVGEVKVLRSKSFVGDPEKMPGWVIEDVGRKAKVIEVYFRKKEEMMIVHLKMTGQLVFVDGEKKIVGGHPTADWVKNLPSKHTRVLVSFRDGSKLFFNDMRVFGWMKLVDRKKYQEEKQKTAPDVIEKEFSEKYFAKIMSGSSKAVKLVLMDQEKIGGVGNIYANDALYLAKVMPNRKASSLSREETEKLWESLREVIRRGIKYGGASAANYVDTRGLGGTYQEHFLVYKRDGQVCKDCGEIIKKMKLGGRGTFYCPKCQR